MLKSEPSFASLLVKQSPSMHFGHGWIVGKDGQRWHPCNSQTEILTSLSTIKQDNTTWATLKLVVGCITNLVTKVIATVFMRMNWRFVIRLYRMMVATFSR